ncbi:MAG: class I mannose-6-phosphate isomerase [Firmicutes bacterium]|nr:class I mannose-6-phosphate isomerase [Bacillota bacterium]
MVPVLQHRIWGGELLPDLFPLSPPVMRPVGEAWLLSDHPTAQTVDEQGGTLAELAPGRPWFPVLIKLLHATSDLSVQVHPNDEQAKAIGDLGKSEGWLILAATPGARICHGLTATTRQELKEAIEQGRIESQLRYAAVQPGDYYPVPPGTVHALGGGILALEVQQSSDTTYRLYDYNRPDATGKLRALHVDEALRVTSFPQPPLPDQRRYAPSDPSGRIVYDDNPYFTLTTVSVSGSYEEPPRPGRLLCSILLDGDVAPASLHKPPQQYATWLYGEGETARFRGEGRVALVSIVVD